MNTKNILFAGKQINNIKVTYHKIIQLPNKSLMKINHDKNYLLLFLHVHTFEHHRVHS